MWKISFFCISRKGTCDEWWLVITDQKISKTDVGNKSMVKFKTPNWKSLFLDFGCITNWSPVRCLRLKKRPSEIFALLDKKKSIGFWINQNRSGWELCSKNANISEGLFFNLMQHQGDQCLVPDPEDHLPHPSLALHSHH